MIHKHSAVELRTFNKPTIHCHLNKAIDRFLLRACQQQSHDIKELNKVNKLDTEVYSCHRISSLSGEKHLQPTMCVNREGLTVYHTTLYCFHLDSNRNCYFTPCYLRVMSHCFHFAWKWPVFFFFTTVGHKVQKWHVSTIMLFPKSVILEVSQN